MTDIEQNDVSLTMKVISLVLRKLGLPDIANFEEARDLVEYCCMRDPKFQEKAQVAFEQATVEVFGSNTINEQMFYLQEVKKKENGSDGDPIDMKSVR